MAKLALHALTTIPVSTEECQNASLILERTFDSVSALLKAFDTATAGSPGRPSDEAIDLLRAMLVMAAAGVDAMVKQLIRDTLPKLARNDDSVRDKLQAFISRRLRDEDDSAEGPQRSRRDFLAKVLASSSHQDSVLQEYVAWLTQGSLQSEKELFRIAEAFGIVPKDLAASNTLDAVFKIRNKIIHELDIEGFQRGPLQRLRNTRNRAEMVKHTNTLLMTAQRMRDLVDKKLVPLRVPYDELSGLRSYWPSISRK
jgi:hypothetical protein